MTGFTYNGIHCSDLGLYYIPSKDDLWFQDPEYDVYDEDIEWKHGGYYFSSKAKVRQFKLKCFFEEIDIAKRQAIKKWLKFNSEGRLIFDDMPFMYWHVHPGKVPVGNWYLDSNESHSGTVTITFNAYEPFGYMIRKSNPQKVMDNAEDYCNIISSDDMPADPTTTSTEFDIYNPGTEECGMDIEISGESNVPIRFFNEANGTFCAFESLPTPPIRLHADGDTGYISVYLPGADAAANGFTYHDKGFVSLVPNYGASNVQYTYGGKNGTLHVFNIEGYTVTNDLKGGKLIADGNEFIISSVSTANNRLYCEYDGEVTVPESGTCSFKTLNHIVIQQKIGGVWESPASDTADWTYIKIDYKPRIM